MAAEKRITIIGCGPGGAGYLAPIALEKALSADCVIGSGRLLALIPENGRERINGGADTAKVIETIAERIPAKSVAVLVSGDPGVFSLAAPVIKKFGAAMCEVIPGVSSIQLAFAKAGLDWWDAKIVSVHAAVPQNGYGAYENEPKLALLAGTNEAVKWIAGLAEKMNGSVMIICENLGMAEESVMEMTPGALLSRKVSSMTVVLLVKKEFLK